MRLFKKKLTTPLQELERQSREGDKLKDFAHGGAYDVLNELILEPLELKAFEAFKKVNPDDMTEVIQTQMMGKMIESIRQEIQGKISLGDVARQQLIEYSNPDSGE